MTEYYELCGGTIFTNPFSKKYNEIYTIFNKIREQSGEEKNGKPIQENIQAMEGAKQGFDENSKNTLNGPWGEKDPFIFLPFLPYFVNQVPKVDETVMIIYFNNKLTKGRNRFYLVGPYSSPTTIFKEDYRSSRTHTDMGNSNSREAW